VAVLSFVIVVADYWQGNGIGQELLRHLLPVAEEVGYERIEGVVLRANQKMLQLSRELGFTVSPYPGDATLVHIGKDLRTNVTDIAGC
jgi:RimJ/RimL family protein N-acetyltransferase